MSEGHRDLVQSDLISAAMSEGHRDLVQSDLLSAAMREGHRDLVQSDLIRPRKVPNPLLDSHTHRVLLKELLHTHKWGMWQGERSELQRVLERRRAERDREEELSLSVTQLQTELEKQRQRLLEYELEEMRSGENPQDIPEFMRVKEKLRHLTL